MIFCQVSRIIPDDSGIPWVTSGTQKWKGDSPNLIARPTVIMFDAIGLGVFSIVHCPVNSGLIIIPNIKSIDVGTQVAQWVGASAFGSGHDPRVLGWSPTSGSLLSGEPASSSLSACLPTCDLCLPNK